MGKPLHSVRGALHSVGKPLHSVGKPVKDITFKKSQVLTQGFKNQKHSKFIDSVFENSTAFDNYFKKMVFWFMKENLELLQILQYVLKNTHMEKTLNFPILKQL